MSFSLVVGLGNPGRDYEGTRHNIGFVLMDALAARLGLSWQREKRFEAEVARWATPGQPVRWLAKPLTYMNESGRAVQALASFHRVAVERMVVVHDELTLDCGRLKVSVGGSPGGHNGITSLHTHVGTGFARFRVGIGPKVPKEMVLADFVLSRFSDEQSSQLQKQLPAWVDQLVFLIEQGADQAMNLTNRKTTHESGNA